MLDVDAALEHFYKEKGITQPHKVKEVLTFVQSLVDMFFDATQPWMKTWSTFSKHPDPDNVTAQKVQELEEQTTKYKQGLQAASLEVTPRKALPLQDTKNSASSRDGPLKRNIDLETRDAAPTASPSESTTPMSQDRPVRLDYQPHEKHAREPAPRPGQPHGKGPPDPGEPQEATAPGDGYPFGTSHCPHNIRGSHPRCYSSSSSRSSASSRSRVTHARVLHQKLSFTNSATIFRKLQAVVSWAQFLVFVLNIFPPISFLFQPLASSYFLFFAFNLSPFDYAFRGSRSARCQPPYTHCCLQAVCCFLCPVPPALLKHDLVSCLTVSPHQQLPICSVVCSCGEGWAPLLCKHAPASCLIVRHQRQLLHYV